MLVNKVTWKVWITTHQLAASLSLLFDGRTIMSLMVELPTYMEGMCMLSTSVLYLFMHIHKIHYIQLNEFSWLYGDTSKICVCKHTYHSEKAYKAHFTRMKLVDG